MAAKLASMMSPMSADVNEDLDLLDGFVGCNATASDLTEIDDFLENTESEYISDDDDLDNLSTIDELRGALRGKEKQIKSLRCAPWLPRDSPTPLPHRSRAPCSSMQSLRRSEST